MVSIHCLTTFNLDDLEWTERPFIGLYALIFGIYWHIKLKRADGWNCILLYGLTANFILCTAYLVINIIEVQFIITVSHIQVVYHSSDVMAPKTWVTFSWLLNSQIFVLNDDSLENAGLWLAATNNALYTTVDFISQFILVSVLHIQSFLS